MTQRLTKKIERASKPSNFEAYLATHQPALIVVEGGAEGSEFLIEKQCLTLGRGPGVDLEFDDDSMSRRHLELAFQDQGFRIRDLGSTNGTLVNGSEVQASDLKHGDRLQLGGIAFRLVIEERDRVPEAYPLKDD